MNMIDRKVIGWLEWEVVIGEYVGGLGDSLGRSTLADNKQEQIIFIVYIRIVTTATLDY